MLNYFEYLFILGWFPTKAFLYVVIGHLQKRSTIVIYNTFMAVLTRGL